MCILYMWICHTYEFLKGQKRSWDPLELELTGICEIVQDGCWETNPGSLEGQQVFLTAEPSLQPWLLGILFFETGPHCVAPSWPRTQKIQSACLLSAGIEDVHHHIRLLDVFWDNVSCNSDCSWTRNVPNNTPWAPDPSASVTAALGLYPVLWIFS